MVIFAFNINTSTIFIVIIPIINSHCTIVGLPFVIIHSNHYYTAVTNPKMIIRIKFHLNGKKILIDGESKLYTTNRKKN